MKPAEYLHKRGVNLEPEIHFDLDSEMKSNLQSKPFVKTNY